MTLREPSALETAEALVDRLTDAADGEINADRQALLLDAADALRTVPVSKPSALETAATELLEEWDRFRFRYAITDSMFAAFEALRAALDAEEGCTATLEPSERFGLRRTCALEPDHDGWHIDEDGTPWWTTVPGTRIPFLP